MKTSIPLSAITALAALALMGCNQNSPSNPTETPSSNPKMSDTNATGGTSSNSSANYNMAHTNAGPAGNDATR